MPTRGRGNQTKVHRALHWYPYDAKRKDGSPAGGEPHEDEIQGVIDAVGLDLVLSKRRLSDEIGIVVDAAGIDLAMAKKGLSHDIGVAENRYWDAKSLRSRRQKFEQLDEISKCAKRLKRLLDDENAWRAIIPHLPLAVDQDFSRRSVATLIEAVHKACHPRYPQNAAEEMVKEIVEDLTKQSPFETLVGELYKVFEKNFGMEAQVNRPNDEKNDTPYIRFVMCILKKLQIPGTYTTESIIRATSIARSGLGRRKTAA
jgi:hypothetical protein